MPETSVSNVLTYRIATTDVSGTVQVTDLSYVDFAKSRLVVTDFNVCFRIIPLTPDDIAGLQEAIEYASSGQAAAAAMCSSSAETYSVASTVLPSTLAVCGTDLKDKLDAIMARPSQCVSKPTDD